MPVVERYLLDVFQRELAQIDLSILRVAQLDAVVEHAHVVRAHASHVYRFESSHTAVIFELHAREIADRVGHRKGTQVFELFTGQFLHGDHFPHQGAPVHHELVKVEGHRRGILHR